VSSVTPDAAEARVSAETVEAVARAILAAVGARAQDAALVARSLVRADLEGVASHGTALLPLYVDRIRRGSVDAQAVPTIESDLGGVVVLSAHNGLGQVSAQHAVQLAIERARQHGIALVSVRNAFHFGTASQWARQFADAQMVGFTFSNTRPLMPAPGGAERVVGNNPMAIAFPSDPGGPLVVDMAMSATAMGRIRNAEANGQPIPLGWATDEQGAPTTSAAEAINGMLLPAAGPKGFGLAVVIDLLCGALSGGALGAEVRPLYGDLDQPYDCAHTFIAIDAARMGDGGIAGRVSVFAETIRTSRKAADTQRIYAPGDLERSRYEANAGQFAMPRSLVAKLQALAAEAGVDARIVDYLS
jgi:LDH2 family malate/lactate/ureidoglycolate dehydrogenase